MLLVPPSTIAERLRCLSEVVPEWHIRVETPIALHSVAHRVSHQIPAESEMSRQNRATPPQIKVSHLSPDPPVALSSHSQQAGGQGGVSRRAGGGYRSTFGFRKRIALQGVSQLQSHQSRYSVQLRGRAPMNRRVVGQGILQWLGRWAIPPVRLGLPEEILERFRKDPGNALRAFS